MAVAATPAKTAAAPAAPAANNGPVITSIAVTGNQRIETSTIASYLLVRVGDSFNQDELDRSIKALYATGLFQDVAIKRVGDGIVVYVLENPIVNQIAFEGRHKLTEDVVKGAITLRSRAVFTTALAEADRKALLALYAKKARFGATVTPVIIRLPENRVNVVFEINEGSATLVSRIAFVGNNHYTEERLRQVVSSREQAWFRFLSTSDTFDPERVAYDAELLRRFYLKAGYADFQVLSSTAELTPDKSSFIVSFTISEGQKYKVGKVSIVSNLRDITPEQLHGVVEPHTGDTYNGDAVERSTTAIEDYVRNRGFEFVEVEPRVLRHPDTHTLDLEFDVGEGPKVYVERIDIQGNTRTQDKVLRRQFALAEGDAYNASVVTKTKTALKDLGYFGDTIDINAAQGAAADRTVLTVKVTEKSTGSLNLGAGYATDYGPLISAGISDSNIVGTGISAGINGSIAAKQNSANIQVANPYLFDRNLVGTVDVFHTYVNNNQTSNYQESRAGITFSAGYAITDHLSQAWNYSFTQRSLQETVLPGLVSPYILQEIGSSYLSQIGQTIAVDYRDSKADPHSGMLWQFGTDYAGLGGDEHYARLKLNGYYYVPLQRLTGNAGWVLAISGGGGELIRIGNHPEEIVDRFFLGGDNLRGFAAGGVGPHDMTTGDSLGGREYWNQTTEVRFPLPVSADVGLTGRAFVDVGGLQGVSRLYAHGAGNGYAPIYNYNSSGGLQQEVTDDGTIRAAAGLGFSWDSPFGLINIDLGVPIHKKIHDQVEFFRFGVGTRF
jgi:outer membrane protein insertion porin family